MQSPSFVHALPFTLMNSSPLTLLVAPTCGELQGSTVTRQSPESRHLVGARLSSYIFEYDRYCIRPSDRACHLGSMTWKRGSQYQQD
jgi:hypothetical protein